MSICSKIKQAVIFAGGRGERLRPLTDHLPKPMAPVLGRPFLDYLLQTLIDAGMTDIVILTGYRSEAISQRYQDGAEFGLNIAYSVGTPDDLTGRRLLNAYGQLEDAFLLLYGDNFWPIEMAAMLAHYNRIQLPAMTTVFSNRHGTGEYGFENNVQVEQGRVKQYDKKRQAAGLNGLDIGFFLVRKDILDPAMKGNVSFEETILTGLAHTGQLSAYVTDRQYYYLTNLSTLKDFEKAVGAHAFEPIHPKARQ